MRIVLAAAAALMAAAAFLHAASAQAPTPTTTRERLALTEGSSTKTYMYELGKKRGTSVGFGGVTIPTNEPETCKAYFQIGLENIVTRSTWRGADVSACWVLFRDNVPPPAAE
jgi:hypothetical protein